MIQRAYSLLDSKAQLFNTPFFAVNDATAVRIVADTASDLATLVGRHPEDFVLYHVGTWNDANGFFEPGVPENLGTVVNFLPKRSQSDMFTQTKAEA